MLKRAAARWLAVPLAARTASYAGATLVVLIGVEIAVLAPLTPPQIAVLCLPLVVCTAITYLLTRIIAARRAALLTEAYRRFERGDLEEDLSFPADPEFQNSRELFLRLARELHSAHRELAKRDAERRRLFSDVVHELGTPVSSLLGLAEAFRMPALSASETQRDKLAGAMLHASERLTVFIEDLRDLAQLDDPQMKLHEEPLALHDLARQAIEGLNAIPNTTRVDVAAEPVEVKGDPARLEQIFVNLVGNARRYAAAPAPIRVTIARDEDRARIVVEDGGPGVEEADLPKLGERMRRLDAARARNRGGTGLGLSIVAAIAERHGGGVRFRRSELGGLAVEVDIPLQGAEPT
jgi:signal transduction histidine kinase